MPYVKADATKGVHYFDSNHFRGDRWYRSYMPTRASRALARSRSGVGRSPVRRRRTTCSTRPLPRELMPPTRRRASSPSCAIPWTAPTAIGRNGGGQVPRNWDSTMRSPRSPRRLEGERERLLSDPNYASYAWEQQSYATQSMYGQALKPWVQRFGPNNVLVAASEDYYRDPVSVLRAVDEFLGLPPRSRLDRCRAQRRCGRPLARRNPYGTRGTVRGGHRIVDESDWPHLSMEMSNGIEAPDLFLMKAFPRPQGGVLLPQDNRRAAADGLCLYTASKPFPIAVQRLAFWLVRGAGTRVLPGRAIPWEPPFPAGVWATLTDAWAQAVGRFEAIGCLLAKAVRTNRNDVAADIRCGPSGSRQDS